MRWQLIHELSGEHRLFQDTDGRLALADQSGETPDQTDDGPMFLDLKRHATTDTGYVDVPVVDENGKPGEVTILWEDAKIIQEKYNLRIQTDEGYVRAKDVLRRLRMYDD